MDWTGFDAVLFDLDGVLTMTATLHATCWKRMFDDFLRAHARRLAETFQPFDMASDYSRYVDGKPRYDGVRDFLESRGITLPEGDPTDGPDRQTICGLGNRKRDLFLTALESDGVKRDDNAVELVQRLKRVGLKTAVVSSSQHCQAILDAAGIAALFDLRVDGNTSRRLGLRGKPAPDTFLEAARQLDVAPARAVVVEDAVAGVQAGRAGRFGRVVGIDRAGSSSSSSSNALRDAGADLVTSDMSTLFPSDPLTPEREPSSGS